MHDVSFGYSPTPEPALFDPDRELAAEIRNLTALVGELTIMLVIQGAYLAAMKNRRSRPTPDDVYDAISAVAEHVPDHVAEGLWGAREALTARFRSEPSA